MTSYELEKVMLKLIGPVQPQGSTHNDKVRADNQEMMEELTETMIGCLETIATERMSTEYSRRVAGLKAHKFLSEIDRQIRRNL